VSVVKGGTRDVCNSIVIKGGTRDVCNSIVVNGGTRDVCNSIVVKDGTRDVCVSIVVVAYNGSGRAMSMLTPSAEKHAKAIQPNNQQYSTAR
jgi:hypothetical protein